MNADELANQPPEAPDPTTAPLGAGLDFADPNSPLAPLYLQPGHVVAAVLLAVVFVFYAFFPLYHTDIWGHMAFGRWMVEHHRLPGSEPFTPFADQDARYVHFQWLSQVGLYLVYHAGEGLAGGGAVERLAGGVEALRLAHAGMATLFYLFLLLAYRRAGGTLWLACVALAVLLALAPAHIAVLRPQVVGVVFFAVLLFCLCRETLSRTALFGVPLLMALWANVHGSFAVGLVLMAAFLAGRAAEVAWRQKSAAVLGDAQVVRLLAVLVASTLLAALLNPHGPALFLHTVALGRHPNVRSMDEWQPLSFALEAGGHWAFLAAVLLLAVSQALSPRWLTPTHWLVLVGFGAWTCWQQRMMIWWLPLAPWGLAYLWGGFAQRPGREWLGSDGRANLRLTLLVGLIAAVTLLVSPITSWVRQGRPRPLETAVSGATPWRLAAELTATPQDEGKWMPDLRRELRVLGYPNGQFGPVIFASEGEGDYLLWALADTGIDVFVYTHGHLFTQDHWEAAQRVKFAEDGWREVLDDNRVNLVVFAAATFPNIVARIRQDGGWLVLLDESTDRRKRDPRGRLFIALRKEPR